MTTANDGYHGGAGGKFRKKVLRKTTPYDRPSIAIRNPNPNNTSKSGFLSKLIYAGADRLLGAFWKRNPALTAPPVTGTNEDQRNELQEEGPNFGLKTNTGASEPSTNEDGNLGIISAATEISDLETMLKQKTFTRSEIERLTALLHSRTTTSDVGEGDKANISDTSHVMRLEASTSGPLNKHVEERENFHAIISTPVVNSRAFEEDVASPAELAKAYMGTRPAKASPSTLRLGSQAPRQDSVLLNNTAILPRTPMTLLAPRTAGSLKGSENGVTTPRSRGRSAIYSMARSPYYRGPSTLSQKPTLPVISSQPAWEQEGSNGISKMAVKRRSSVLDDLGSGGPMRRIRQKANLYSQGSSLSKHKNELDSSAQRLLLRNEPEQKASKATVENGETSKNNSGYASVPTESTRMASKIFEHLERMSPKEKPSSSRLAGTTEKSATKLTSNLALGSVDKMESPNSLLSSQNNQKSEGQHHIEENGPKQFAVPLNVLSSMNGNPTVPVRGNAPTTNADSTLAASAEPPQKKRAFQMSAHEDSQAIDEDIRSNGHVSIPLGENTKPETSLLANNNVSAVAPTEVFQTPAAIPNVVSPPKADSGSPGGSVVNKQKVGNNLQASPPSISIGDAVSPQKKQTVWPTYDTSTKSAEKVSAFSFAAKDISRVKQNISSTNNSSITNGTATNSPTAASTVLPASTPASIFNFVSATASSTPAIVSQSVTEAPDTSATKDKEPKSNIFSCSTVASTSFSSPPATSTLNGHQGFGLPTNTQVPTTVTQAVPYKFGSPSTVIPSSTSGSPLFSSSAHSFGPVSAVAPSEIKSSSSTSNFGSPSFSFGAPFQAPCGNPFAAFGTPTASLNNNDQMSMEDSMHEDYVQTPSPAIPASAPASAGTPEFAFNSGTPTPSPSPFAFQFGVQPNQPPSQNAFQASDSLGSFSLGSGGGDKSSRRIVRASKIKNRRK